jgi:hypothetical protein
MVAVTYREPRSEEADERAVEGPDGATGGPLNGSRAAFTKPWGTECVLVHRRWWPTAKNITECQLLQPVFTCRSEQGHADGSGESIQCRKRRAGYAR